MSQKIKTLAMMFAITALMPLSASASNQSIWQPQRVQRTLPTTALSNTATRTYYACVSYAPTSATHYPVIKIKSQVAVSGAFFAASNASLVGSIRSVSFKKISKACGSLPSQDWATGTSLSTAGTMGLLKCELIKIGVSVATWTRKTCVVEGAYRGAGVGYSSNATNGGEGRAEVGIFFAATSSGAKATTSKEVGYVVKITIKTSWACNSGGLGVTQQNLSYTFDLRSYTNTSTPAVVGSTQFASGESACSDFTVPIP